MKTVKFYKAGTTVRVFDYDDEQITSNITPAVYSVEQDMGGYYLRFVSNKFDVPSKVFGSTSSRAEKILKTYDDRTRSTGILLTGDKGSGKTMLSSLVSNKMIERGLPVILIEQPFTGTAFVEFLNNIGESVLFFDEFGKIFNSVGNGGENNEGGLTAMLAKNKKKDDAQESLLSVFDGANTIKRLILLTENDSRDINAYMLNRPGRVYYHFRYKKVEDEVVKEFCQFNKVPEDIIKAILLKVASSIEFSFDSLKAVVEEYLRFKEDINVIFANLNIEQARVYQDRIKAVKLINVNTKKEIEVKGCDKYDNSVYVYFKNIKEDGDYEDSANFSTKEIVEKKENGETVYLDRVNGLLLVTRPVEETFNYSRYLAF